MDMLALLIGLAIGCLLGWLLGQRKAAPTDSRVENELRQQLAQREGELTQAREQLSQTGSARASADTAKASAEAALVEQKQLLSQSAQAARQAQEKWEQELSATAQRLNATASALATAEARLGAAEKSLAEQRQWHEQTLAAAKLTQEKALADLREAFKALSADALKQTQPEFLRLANETLGKFAESAKGDLQQRQESIATLVKPLEEQLKTYQHRLAQSETTQSATLGEVKKQLESLAQQSQLLNSETLQLRRVLSSNQARGRWGEETLRRVVEAAGMSAHCDFTEQAQADDKKPDLIVRLPGDRLIIVDAKVPDLDFLNAMDAADATQRATALAAHAAKLKATIKALAEKDYPAQFPNALDHVVLFLPAESLFSAALEGDHELIVWAAGRRIMLATPASLIALLRSVSVSWQQHAQTVNAKEICEAAQELFARVSKFTEHFEKIRGGLERANTAYNDAVGSYERMVRPSGERLVKLGAGASGKELADAQPLDTTLRLPPSNPSAGGVTGVLLALCLWLATAVLPANAAPAGAVVAWGAGTSNAANAPNHGQSMVPAGLSGVTAIAGGYFHTVALKSDGMVVAWGRNEQGQTTVPASMSGLTAIAAGGFHNVALKSDGSVVAWGYNGSGQTIVPAGLSGVTAIAAGFQHTVALKTDGTVVAWGDNGRDQTTIPAGLSGVTAIAAGQYHTVALKSNGTVVAWGAIFSDYGQTTVPDSLSNVTAIAAGGFHTVALKSDGTVVAWGSKSLFEKEKRTNPLI